MICFPNSKINLGLYVTGRRDDGYHDLETVFYPLIPSKDGSAGMLNDLLEAVPADANSLHTSGLAVSGDTTENLVWKAYQLLSAAYPGRILPLSIYLHKAMPMGAGLGGGSADGSFMLRMLNEQFSLGAGEETLLSMALQLGSDCPFFIRNRPQFASGRGEQMADISIDLSAYNIQVICPKVHVATGAAFKMMQPEAAAYDLRQLHTLPVEEWRNNIANDFEQPVFQQHPTLAAIKEQLYAQGAIYAAMSGSGSAIYGIFAKGARAEIIADVAFTGFYM